MVTKNKNWLVIVSIFVCMLLFMRPVLAEATPTQKELEDQLAAIEREISGLQKQLDSTKTEKTNLTNKINSLKKSQDQLRLQIKSTGIKLKQVEDTIQTTEDSIQDTKKKLTAQQERLSVVLRLINQKDRESIIFSLLRSGGLSEVYNELKQHYILSRELTQLTEAVQQTQKNLEHHLTVYEENRTDMGELLKIKTIQEKNLVNKLQEQSSLLQETKGKESNYQTQLALTQEQAKKIRNRIYDLFESAKTISFGDAVDVANWVSKQTGIRPAFLLAILTQESSLGKNVGTCNRAGDPPEKSWKVVMKPDRDQEPFRTITEELTLDTDTTPVSCPMHDKKGKQIGWGGAMGPAQFIPSTWMGYRAKVTALTGRAANPWEIKDAFVAAAIKLTSDGGTNGEQNEWKAAMKYFSGSTNVKYRFYGDNVLATAERYQKDIDQIGQN